MSKRFPDRLDPWRFADLGKEIGGELPLDTFSRLSACLLKPAGNVSFRLSFGRDQERRAILRGWLKAKLSLQCQRCLEEVNLPIDTRLSVVFVQGLDEAEMLAEDLDPCLVEDDQVVFRDLIEDELLLALPQVAMHDPGACAAPSLGVAEEKPSENSGQERENPFAALAEFKRDKE
ncbi:MAG: YceD family protein [Candidatus Thiodiazotropha sp.]